MYFVLVIKYNIRFLVWDYLAFVEVAQIKIYSADDETTVFTPNCNLNSRQHITNLYDYIANFVEEKLRFYSCFQLPEMGPTEQRQYFTAA